MKHQQGMAQGRRDFLRFLGIGGGAAFLSGLHLPTSFAKEFYPADRIQWICYTKAGGGFDLVARNIAPYLGRHLKEVSKGAKGGDILVKNVSEAGGIRAFNTIYNAKPDGYTIGDFNTGYYCEAMFTKSEIDFYKYTYLARTGISSRLIVTNKNGFKNWAEMMKAGKEKELKWACGNFGSGNHISAILLKLFAKVPARLVNFLGTADNANAILRGDVEMGNVTDESAKPLIEAGELRALAVLSDKSDYPGVPSLVQLGYPELAAPTLLHRMIIGPPNLPEDIKDVLQSAFKKTLSDGKFLAQAKQIGFDPDPLYGAAAERLVKDIFKYFDQHASLFEKYLK